MEKGEDTQHKWKLHPTRRPEVATKGACSRSTGGQVVRVGEKGSEEARSILRV